MRADLHLHSTSSDGVLSPELLAHECAAAHLDVMAITDHDTFAGGEQLRRSGESRVKQIAGVELSLSDMNGLHLLCYGLAERTPLHRVVTELAVKRRERAIAMLARLKELGMPLSIKELERRSRGTIGRPHIARAMVGAGYVASMQEAFERYIGHDGPAYVAGERLTMAEALALTAQSGYISVLAHPYELRLPEENMTALIGKWASQGLRGLEVYHPSAVRYGDRYLLEMARRHHLLVTGGSDFHQEHDKHGSIGCMCDAWTDAAHDIAALMRAVGME